MTLRLSLSASVLALSAVCAMPAWAAGAASSDLAAESLAVANAVPETAAAPAATPTTASPNAAAAETYLLTAPGTAPAGTPLAAGAGPAEGPVTAAVLAAAAAQSGPSQRPERFTLVMNQDSFFGFYPTFNGLIPVSETVDFSFYGILWTTDAFGTALGSDLWTEFGVGANFLAADGALAIKPQLGITNGALLSRGALGTGPRNTVTTLNGNNVFDGIVPSLTVNYSDPSFEAEFYGGYYAALRNRSENVGALDFLHTWVNAGYKFSSNFSAGAHVEVLANTRVDTPTGRASNVYQWFGPYVQFTLKNGFFARFTGGIEEGGGAAGNRGDFYKLAAGFSF